MSKLETKEIEILTEFLSKKPSHTHKGIPRYEYLSEEKARLDVELIQKVLKNEGNFIYINITGNQFYNFGVTKLQKDLIDTLVQQKTALFSTTPSSIEDREIKPLTDFLLRKPSHIHGKIPRYIYPTLEETKLMAALLKKVLNEEGGHINVTPIWVYSFGVTDLQKGKLKSSVQPETKTNIMKIFKPSPDITTKGDFNYGEYKKHDKVALQIIETDFKCKYPKLALFIVNEYVKKFDPRKKNELGYAAQCVNDASLKLNEPLQLTVQQVIECFPELKPKNITTQSVKNDFRVGNLLSL